MLAQQFKAVKDRSGGAPLVHNSLNNKSMTQRRKQHLFSWLMILSGIMLTSNVFGQATISTNYPLNRVCKNQTVAVTMANSPAGATNWVWNWGDGSGNTPSTIPQTQHFYATPGKYVINCLVTGGSPATTILSDTVYVNELPNADIFSTNGTKFCNPATVCFRDNSTIATPLLGQPNAPLTSRLVLFGDGGRDQNAVSVKNFCYSYPTPDYNVYTITISVKDANGCVDTLRLPNYIFIVGDLGARFTVSAPEGCKQTPVKFETVATFFNQTRAEVVYPDSVKRFRWVFGDGSFDTVNWLQTVHTYKTHGIFTPSLIVEDINGCKDTFSINGGVRNTFFAFDVDAIANPICANPGVICWKQTAVAGATKVWEFWISPNPPFNPTTGTYTIPSPPGWKPLSPDPKIFTEDGTFEPCRTIPCGMARTRLKITAPGCKDTTWFWDTVEVLGPKATIEIPGQACCAIADSERYQCKIIYPIHFPNNSCHYKAFNVLRTWDFGDRYARQCTTDTKNGINVTGDDTLSLIDPAKYPPGVNRPCNCNFSKDSLPIHMYTDWDTLALRSVGGQPFLQPNQAPYSTKNFPCYTVKLILYDTVNHCGDTAQVQLPLGPPKAGPNEALVSNGKRVVYPDFPYQDPTTLQWSGIMCFGAAPNGILFNLNKTVPSCTRAWVAINYDSAAGIQDNKWVKQPGHFTQLNNQGPWAIPPPPKAWPNIIAKNYFDPPGLADTNGWVTVGLIAANGFGANMCYDTAYYHKFLRFTPFTPAWDIVDKFANGNVKDFGCKPFLLRGSIRKDYQDSILTIIWNWQDGWADVDSIFRPGTKRNNQPVVNYARYRYKINPQGQIVSTTNVSFVTDSIVGEDTLSHVYTQTGRYYPNVTMINTAGCMQFSAKEIVVGFFSEATVNDTVVCVGDTVTFRDSAYYYIKPEPIFPPYYVFRLGRDPWLGGYRSVAPTPPFAFEQITWKVDKRSITGTDSFVVQFVNGANQYAFKERGLYTISMIVRDSTGCYDTARVKVNVVGVDAGVYVPNTTFACDDTARFYDQSVMYDIYKNVYGKGTDSIKAENQNGFWWEFGDGKTPSPLKDPYHDYTAGGVFTVRHVVETYNGCRDTIETQITIDGPIAEFDILDSVGCAPFRAEFDNKSQKSQSYIWYFGDPLDPFNQYTTDADTNVRFTYKNPGVYNVFLLAKDRPSTQANLCPVRIFPDTTSPFAPSRKIYVLETPNANILTDTPLVCAGDTIFIDNNSSTTYTTHNFNWGDNKTSQTTGLPSRTFHLYDTVGVYKVSYTPDYVPGTGLKKCLDTDSLLVAVVDVIAAFDTMPGNQPPYFNFQNNSVNGAIFDWHFYDMDPTTTNVGGCVGRDQSEIDSVLLGKSMTDKIAHCFGNDTGWFKVCLIAYSPQNCVDSVCMWVENRFTVGIGIPNVFTPDNGDNFNNVFDIPILGEEFYDLVIFNRWGGKVFESKNPAIDWNGKVENNGAECPDGVYYFIFKWKLRGGKYEERTGPITLIREKK